MADISAVVVDDQQQQQSLKVAQTPSFCRLCNIELRGLQTWKAHIKSDNHVHKLQTKVAEPGSVTSPPTPSLSAGIPQSKTSRVDHFNHDADQDQHFESDAEDEEEGEQEEQGELFTPEFIPGNCIFCAKESSTLDDNIKHMTTAHGFSVPFQDLLAVDLETVVSYFHFIIFTYRECICCGTRRGSLEGVQQHMIAKGHCRFDISPETEEFYRMPEYDNVLTEKKQDASEPVRLPSGKIISHRKHHETELRAPRRPSPDHKNLDQDSNPPDPGMEVAHRRTVNGSREIVQANEDILAAQLSRLKVTSDRAQQREEKRVRGRLERANNFFALKRFRLDAADGRMGRQF
ncbi:hypothetical protein FSARC_5504 [Fusarium sarcochroum]|uniref:ZN622/Rei1/Reh1 zinc finger C2H2-type domain-containing protein n=1 Tax=Fusarium sarcochroum TaxID=1208366 RepID=A0A8H4TZB4_9HYPO|nr:hypothetical protein FSARC_5504 [Fusarium sarcochroum]